MLWWGLRISVDTTVERVEWTHPQTTLLQIDWTKTKESNNGKFIAVTNYRQGHKRWIKREAREMEGARASFEQRDFVHMSAELVNPSVEGEKMGFTGSRGSILRAAKSAANLRDDRFVFLPLQPSVKAACTTCCCAYYITGVDSVNILALTFGCLSSLRCQHLRHQ